MQRKQQCDVDVDPSAGELFYRRQAGGRTGHLDHHVWLVEPFPQIGGLRDRGLGVVGQVGRALERDEPVGTSAAVVDRA